MRRWAKEVLERAVTEDYGYKWDLHEVHGAILTIRAPVWISEATVGKIATSLRRIAYGGVMPRRPSARALALFEFQLDRPKRRDSWRREMVRWNRAHPRWRYDDPRNFRTDVVRSANAVMPPAWGAVMQRSLTWANPPKS